MLLMIAKILAVFVLLLATGLWVATFIIASNIEKEFPPVGRFVEVNGSKMHFVDTGPGTDKPVAVFIHGASANLNDQVYSFREVLEDRLRLIFPDRPGHGYSEAFPGSNSPAKQADRIAALLAELKISKAVIVGHSFGGAVAAAFGVLHPDRTSGLVLLAPATHPWPTGVAWYYDVANTPVLGWVFTRLLATPIGGLFLPEGVKGVFAPNPVAADYIKATATRLVFRPSHFHANAKDVANLISHVTLYSKRYSEIKLPTVIFHGDADETVSPEIHSVNGLSKDIEGSKLVVLGDMGHKLDYVAREEISKAVMAIAEGRDYQIPD